MADREAVRRIALSLPYAEEDGRFALAVYHRGKRKGFAWVWRERVAPKGPRLPRPEVLAARRQRGGAAAAARGGRGGVLHLSPTTAASRPSWSAWRRWTRASWPR